MLIRGKGFYIWQVLRTEGGSASAIADLAVLADFSHVLVKIADGTSAYNIDSTTGFDYASAVVQALQQRGILALGWHYVYGYDPEGEAEIAISRVRDLNVDAYVIDAESQYKLPGRDEAARLFMNRLREALPNLPIALSSYRFPTLHPQLPWQAFLEKCDYNMPQMYWVGAHNPAEQLVRCVREFEAITPFRPIIPTGAAYLQGDWQPTVADEIEFLSTAQNLGLIAANFWEWAHCRLYLPDIWNIIQYYPWPRDPTTKDITLQYIEALNTHDVDQVLALYHPNAAHVTGSRSIQGLEALRAWFDLLLNQLLPNATFHLHNFTSDLTSRRFQWTAVSSIGSVLDGNDALGLVDGKIAYHYTSFTIT